MKTILRTMLALLVVSAGLAWAADGPVEEQLPTAQTELPAPVEPAADQDQELTAEDLETMDPDLVEADFCCIADCYVAWGECIDGCGGNTACRQACHAERNACKAGC